MHAFGHTPLFFDHSASALAASAGDVREELDDEDFCAFERLALAAAPFFLANAAASDSFSTASAFLFFDDSGGDSLACFASSALAFWASRHETARQTINTPK